MRINIFIKTWFHGNPRGAGESAAIIEYTDPSGNRHTRVQRARVENETKNTLTLRISIAAMRLLLKPCQIILYMDSDYLANACQRGLITKWQQAGWKRAGGKPLANAGEWKQLHMLMEIHKTVIKAYDSRYDAELENIHREEKKSEEDKGNCD